MNPTTLFEKIWRAHEVVAQTADTPAVGPCNDLQAMNVTHW